MPRDESYDEYPDQVLPTHVLIGDQAGSHQPGPRGILGILLFLAAVTLVFGIARLVQEVKNPFAPTKQSSSQQAQQILQTPPDQEALKKIDTDGDGLSDYDEINIYHTSPYLKDSDSDGKDDKAEIAAGTDPNCPEGQNCFSQTLPSSNAGTGTVPKQTDPTAVLSGGGLSSTDVNSLLNPSPSDLRALMLQSGVPADQLSKIDDTTLLSLYKKTVSGGLNIPGTNGTSATTSPTTSSTGAATVGSATGSIDPAKLANPDQLTTAEMRQILLQSGKVTQDQLSGVDDTTLRAAFLQAAKDNKKP